jgi:hypothetical protein
MRPPLDVAVAASLNIVQQHMTESTNQQRVGGS